MQQAADIRDAVEPDEILFVVDAMIGQDAVNTAQAFLDGVGFDGVVLTKLDGDARGGAALSIASVTGKPVMFASTGEKLDRLRRLPPRPDGLAHPRHGRHAHPDRAGREGLRRRAGREGGRPSSPARAATSPSTTSSQQMQQLRKMGSLSKILGMLPGMGQFREQLENFDEREIDRIQAIIQSMTPAERANPKIINGSRRARIAKGSGTQVTDVNQLVDRFFEARKMMMSMAKGGGMPGMPGHARRAARRQAGQGQAGRPRRARASAARATRPSARPSEKAAAQTAAARRRRPTRSALPAGADEDFDPSSLDLPADLSKYLERSCPSPTRTCPRVTPVSTDCRDAVGRVAAMTGALRFRGPVLPDGEPRDLYVVDGRVTYEPVAARRAGRRGLDRARPGRRALPRRARRARRGRPRTTSEQQALADRDAGALLLRDCGSAADTRWIHDRDDLPRLIRAGRHIARTKRYIRNYAHEIEPDELRGVRRRRRRSAATAGSSWSATGSTATPATWRRRWPGGGARRRDRGRPRARRPGHRARASARTSLPDLIDAGIDCIEHGTGLTDRPHRRDGRAAASRWCRRSCSSTTSREYADAGAARSSRRTPTTCATCTPAAARRSWRPTRRACRSTPAPTPAECCRTA